MTEFEPDLTSEVLDEQLSELAEPPLYRVLIHNDHYTTMEFVVEILREVFHYEMIQAEQIMMMVHRTGIGCCGEYEYQIAESKVAEVDKRATEAGFPLRCTMEKI